MTARFRTFSQAPRAVRSASGRRWDGVFPASALANGTLQTDKGDAFRLTVQVHRLRNISSTAAVRAVVRSHSSPPSVLKGLCTTGARNSREDCFTLRITNKNLTDSNSQPPEARRGRKLTASGRACQELNETSRHSWISKFRSQEMGLGER